MSFKELRPYLVTAILMSLAWSLRGQFGHLKGALIPGALSAVAVALLSPAGPWREALWRSLLLSAFGFSLGGQLGYGSLIREILASTSLSVSTAGFLKLFFIGAVWGGLGMTYLGLGLSEKPIKTRDLLLWGGLALLGWFVPELPVLAFLFAALQLYNLLRKKSKTIAVFGTLGALGFGTGFLLSVLLLFLGQRGFLGEGWPWWSLRDQFLGLWGGLFIWGAVKQSLQADLLPAPWGAGPLVQKGALSVYLVWIPGISTYNALRHWGMDPSIFSPLPLGIIALGFVSFFSLLFAMILRLKNEKFSGAEERKLLSRSTFFFLWYLSFIAIAKEMLRYGWGRWEFGFTLFLVFSLLLTGVLLQRKEESSDLV